MYVIILGAGKIGYSIAEILISNQHEVCLLYTSDAADE